MRKTLFDIVVIFCVFKVVFLPIIFVYIIDIHYL